MVFFFRINEKTFVLRHDILKHSWSNAKVIKQPLFCYRVRPVPSDLLDLPDPVEPR